MNNSRLSFFIACAKKSPGRAEALPGERIERKEN